MFASYLSREKEYPTLLITSADGTPEWTSPLEAFQLCVGLCDFTCCQRNHIFGDKVVPCDRDITRIILKTLIDAKVARLFKSGKMKLARLFFSTGNWWTRPTGIYSCVSFGKLKKMLNWDDEDGTTKPWIDRDGISILAYAVVLSEIVIVKSILKLYANRKTDLLAWRFPKEGVIETGTLGHSDCLYLSMGFASPEIVIALLDAGANVETTDIIGNDPLMIACVLNRLKNVKTWFTRYDAWNVNRRSKVFGATALNLAIAHGPRKLEVVRYLVRDRKASLQIRNKSGYSALALACSNVDADPKVVRYLLEQSEIDVNNQIAPQTFTLKVLYSVARFAVRDALFLSLSLSLYLSIYLSIFNSFHNTSSYLELFS